MMASVLIRGNQREFILGDLDELYARRASRRGRLWASLGYTRDVLASLWRGGGGLSPSPPERPRRPLWTAASADLFAETRQAVRALRRTPAFTLLLAATLALGIGPTIVILSMVDQLLMRPLPGAGNSAAASHVRLLDPESARMGLARAVGLTLREFDALRDQTSVLVGMASSVPIGSQVRIEGGRPIRISTKVVYGDFFEVLGVQASAGRLISADQTALHANPLIVVISEHLRERLFGPDADAVGRVIRMNGHAVEVVGVTSGGFRGAVRGDVSDAWLPFGALVPLVGFAHERLPSSRAHLNLLVLPRVGVAPEAVGHELEALLARVGDAEPDRRAQLARLVPTVLEGLHEPPGDRERPRRTLGIMGWAAVLLLGIACANVATLLLFQNLARRGHVATARALGASTLRIVGDHLLRTTLVGALGSIAGALLGFGVAALFRGELLLGMPEFEGLELNRTVVLGVFGALAVTTLVSGVLPALMAGRFDVGKALRASGSRETGRLGPLRTLLSGAQIAATLALMVGGLLMYQTTSNLRGVDTGVEVEGIVGATFDLPEDLAAGERHELQRRVLAAVSAQSGVERVALDLFGPHGTQPMSRVGLPDDSVDVAQLASVLLWQVSPGWFELFGLGLLDGRTFQDADWSVPSSETAILTQSLARRLFGRGEAVGRTVWVQRAVPSERRVIGVVRDYTSLLTVAAASTDAVFRPSGPIDALFLPYGEAFDPSQVTVFAQMAASSTNVPATVQSAIEAEVADVPSPEPYLLQERVDRIHREERLLGRLLLTLAGFGALMSGVGLFAAIYFMVASRKRELGIRVALGADPIRILKLVTRSAAAIVLGGVTAGLVLAYPLSSALRSRLYGIEHLDPISYGTAALALALVALLACLAPAREALRADPVAVLREE
ncbi:MAG TPA: ABC transporter permease [Longimicrobiales bacterium]|nr:ABC transporter permease [Longimicrobiales bacterium]